MNSKTVADPLNLYDCCPTSDGASVAIVASESVARERPTIRSGSPVPVKRAAVWACFSARR